MNLIEKLAARTTPPSRAVYRVGKDLVGFDAGPASLIVSGVNEQECSAPFIISTQSVDSDGDEVVSRGCDLTDYRKNPIVLFGHDSTTPPIGLSKSTRTGDLAIKIENSRVVATCYFDQHDPDAMYLFGKVARGYLNAASVGFIPLDALPRTKDAPGWRFKRWLMREWSILPLGANAEALRMGLERDKGVSVRVRKWLEPYAAQGKVWMAKPATEKTPMNDMTKEAAGMSEAVGPDGGNVVDPCVEKKIAEGLTPEQAKAACAEETASTKAMTALTAKVEKMDGAMSSIAQSIGQLAESIASLMEATKPAQALPGMGAPAGAVPGGNVPPSEEPDEDGEVIDPAAEDEDPPAPGEEDEEEEAADLLDEYRKPPKKKPGAKGLAKRMNRACKECIAEAAAYMDEVAGLEDTPRRHKAGMKYHSGNLMKVLQAGDTPDEPEEKALAVILDADAIAAALEPLRSQLSGVKTSLYELTGQE